MGIFFGLFGALCFSLTSILVRVGQRTRPKDDGVFMSVLVNVLLLGAVALFVDWPAWDTGGIQQCGSFVRWQETIGGGVHDAADSL